MRFASLLIAICLGACTLPRPRLVADEGLARSMAPVARLGRWDGERFVEVAPGTLPPSRLRVLVHGWTPGRDRRSLREGGMRSWEMTTRDGRPFEPWMSELARMFTLHDPHAVVVAFSWVDDSSTIAAPVAARRALVHTTGYGQVLAEAIEAGLASDFYAENGSIQLVGHSYGARVATIAAGAMETPPAQLTMFDAPDGVMVEFTGIESNLRQLLEELPLGWGRGHTFADNYVSMVGRRYGWRDGLGEVRDVVLAPPFGSLDYRGRHLYPMRFYAQSPGRGYGYDWSPLSGRTTPPQDGCFEQRTTAAPALVRGCTDAP
ncbi:MAG: hypothetical protein U0234_03940 [Sandaracinus sp.]